MNGVVILAGHGLSVAAYLGLAVWALFVRRGLALPSRRGMVTGCLATAMWAGCSVFAAVLPRAALNLVEIVRIYAWLQLMAQLYEHNEALSRSDDTARRFLTGRALWLAEMVVGIVAVLAALPAMAPFAVLLVPLNSAMVLSSAVVGMVLAEKVFFGSGLSARWGLKYLMLGVVTVFVLDFYLQADALMLHNVSGTIVAARGLVVVLVVPLLAVAIGRMKSWTRTGEPTLNVSREAALHGMALLGSGIYLLAMAGIAFFVREAGGVWGSSLRITFLVGGFLVMFVALGSGSFVSRAKIYIYRTFFTYKYDYREEWRRFIGMMSAHQPLTLGERIVHAVADMMDSPSGALWLRQRQDDVFVPDCEWNYHGVRPAERADSPFIAYLRQTGWVLETDDAKTRSNLPPWILEHARAGAWLVIPLIHRGEVLAFLVLDRARAPRRLDWEDRDLLKTA
ncbi:MAG: PEP-CTERM system histidine kinase PrsK, partial [Alphaproteobacteria bacterium]|nr:PEP-CTERM system histidine kinase PrsK [Alphaproteobacteria bacterium]